MQPTRPCRYLFVVQRSDVFERVLAWHNLPTTVPCAGEPLLLKTLRTWCVSGHLSRETDPQGRSALGSSQDPVHRSCRWRSDLISDGRAPTGRLQYPQGQPETTR